MGLDPVAVQLLTGGGTAGLIFCLLVAVWAFANRKVISRGSFDDLIRERDEYKQLYFEEAKRADEAVGSVTKLAELVRDVLDELPERDPPPRRRRHT